jgi:DNA-binding CsgD family transcriptional regulator
VLPADADAATIAAAARLVAAGLVVLPEALIAGEEPPEPAAGAVVLTPRERQVLELLAAGASNKLIARRLGISVHTAKFHVASLLAKLGASGRLEAVGLALRLGLVMV